MLSDGAMSAGALKGSVAAAIAFSGMSLLARDAFAQACTVSTDCPKGFLCFPGGAVPDSGVASTCISGQCQNDSDCAAAFRCLFGVGSICTSAAEGGQDCQPNNVCAPQWEVPCTEDSQCGPGFACALDGGALPDPASTIGNPSVIDCGPGRFDASIPSYDTGTWLSCSDVAEPPLVSICDDAGSDLPSCPPPLCEAGTMCLVISGYSCSSPAVYQSCQSEADCPATWTCVCPPTCGSEVFVPADGGPFADAECATVCIPPNAELTPGYGVCGSTANASAPATSSGGLDAGSANASSANGAQATDSVQGGGCQAAPRRAGDAAGLLVLAALLAAARARTRRA